jgi:diguanylate cyclase (GGDEF)-like protein/PAS domain S-box-containing protein
MRLVAVLLSNSAGGVLARRLLAPAVVLPIVIGWLSLKAQQAGWFGTQAGVALVAMANALVIGALVWVTARFLHRSSLKRRRVEEAMHEHMERLATIIANEPECVKVINGAGELVEMNPAGLTMLEESSLADAQQRQLIQYVLPAHRDMFGELHHRVMQGESGKLEFEITGRRGTRRWLETHAAPLRDKTGKVWALLGVTRDISERKRAASSQAQVQLFRDLLDRTNDLIYIADAVTARVLDCNATLPARLGYSYEEILQMRVWDLSTAAGAPYDWAERVARVQATGSLVIGSDYRRKDGSKLPVEISLSYVGHEPQPLLVAVTRDVTERRVQEARAAHFTLVLKMHGAIQSAVLRIRDPDELLQEVCRVATELGAYATAIVSLVDRECRKARPKYRSGLTVPSEPDEIVIGDGTDQDVSVTGRALRTGELALCSDLRHSEPAVLGREELLRLGMRSIIALPVTVDGARVGALTLLSRSERRIDDEELVLLQDVAITLGLGLQSQQHADAAQFLTNYDPLTGLPKRALFCEQVNALIRSSPAPLIHPIVAVFDIHDLSGFNDTFGRSFGDSLLQKVAERVRRIVQSERHVGHLGGGTFALAMREAPGVANSLAAMIDREVFELPFETDGRTFRVTGRSGLARYPLDGHDAATLVQKAEAALRHAKESGERYLHFKLQMRSDVTNRLQLEHELREAIDAHQFVLYYQPQISIATGRIASVEALLRWNNPQAGILPPAQFLPVLESSEMIVTVGNWVMAQACEDCREFRRRALGPLRISVNVSALQIRRRTFVEEVLRSAEGFGSDGYGIDIEITETSVLQDLEDTRRKLRLLREAGIRIAIDDFGTGYSSLGLLPTLPIDILKIDRAFIQGLPENPASVALTSSIIQIASAFGLATVAEGVESVAQLEKLRTLNCHQSQGYLHWKPMPIEALGTLLERQRSCDAPDR